VTKPKQNLSQSQQIISRGFWQALLSLQSSGQLGRNFSGVSTCEYALLPLNPALAKFRSDGWLNQFRSYLIKLFKNNKNATFYLVSHII
jgi:hypothetical protein